MPESFIPIENWYSNIMSLLAVEISFESWLDQVGQAVQKRATEKFGVYQPAIGQWPAWPPLSLSTIYRKNFDAPLIGLTGTLRRSIEYSVGPNYVVVGTNVVYGIYHEFGTSHHPPRPFIGPAFTEEVPKYLPLLAGEVAAGLFLGRNAFLKNIASTLMKVPVGPSPFSMLLAVQNNFEKISSPSLWQGRIRPGL